MFWFFIIICVFAVGINVFASVYEKKVAKKLNKIAREQEKKKN